MAFLAILHTIAKGDPFDKAVTKEAKDLLDSFCRFVYISNSFIFLRIIKSTMSLSLHLQTKGVDIMNPNYNRYQEVSTACMK